MSEVAQPNQKRFCVINLGCKVNRVESDTIAASCMAAGAVASEAASSDVVVINTCTVTAEADAKTRKAVRKASREGNCPVIVTGCAAAIDPKALSQLGNNVVVEPIRFKAAEIAVRVLVGNEDCGGAAGSSIAGDSTADSANPITSDNQADFSATAPKVASTPKHAFEIASPEAIELRAGEGFKTRMDIKIQDGCPNSCTYCIVTRARGDATSVPLQTVVQEVAKAADAGVGEVILTGINLGCYNSDGLRLPGLIRTILNNTEIGRVRVSSIEPPHVDQNLVEVLEEFPGRFCAHLHIPLQSGCDKTLAAMGRLYDSEDFARRVQMIRDANPAASITTDLIVGFPQETDDDFEQSFEFCRQMAFSKIHVFRYSRRRSTPAASMPGQVDPHVMAERARRMRDLSAAMRLADMQKRVGTTENVLMMSDELGMSESYHDVDVTGIARKGELVQVLFTGVDHGCLTGQLLV